MPSELRGVRAGQRRGHHPQGHPPVIRDNPGVNPDWGKSVKVEVLDGFAHEFDLLLRPGDVGEHGRGAAKGVKQDIQQRFLGENGQKDGHHLLRDDIAHDGGLVLIALVLGLVDGLDGVLESEIAAELGRTDCVAMGSPTYITIPQ